MKKTSIVRDWHSLAQGDPQPTEGALVSEDLLRLIRDTTTVVEPQKIAVAVDPSGGGRDTAGIVGGFLGDDGRLWITDDRTDVMSSADWSRQACLLAYETNAAVLIYEKNFGGDMVLLVIRSAWDALVKEGKIPAEKLPPQMKPVHAKQGKLLRAEPIAQQMILDRVRLRGIFVDLEREWCVWQPTDPLSPGRIDASVYLAYGLLPIPSPGTTSMGGIQKMAETNLLPWAAR
jgi:phage terminase large subunit-like protein